MGGTPSICGCAATPGPRRAARRGLRQSPDPFVRDLIRRCSAGWPALLDPMEMISNAVSLAKKTRFFGRKHKRLANEDNVCCGLSIMTRHGREPAVNAFGVLHSVPPLRVTAAHDVSRCPQTQHDAALNQRKGTK